MALINMNDGDYRQPNIWTEGQGVTDPGVRAASPTDPNDPAEIARLNGIYGPNGTALNKPTDTSTWNPNQEVWNTATQQQTPDLMARIQAALANARSSDDPNYWFQKISGDPNGAGSAWGYWLDRINRGDGAQLGLPRFQDGGGTPAGGTYNASNPFSDPATKGYIDLLNSRIQQLLTPQHNPDMDPLLSYMRQYFQQLQQPTYTDAQRATIATQQLDPMERQRQARKQQVIQQMASRGMGPSDGPTIAALAQIDRDYDTQRAQAQGGIATNEINLGRQNQAQAVDVGSAIASLQNGMFNQQDQRANQAVNLGAQIPNMAQSRLQQSIQLLNGSNVNPASLFGSQQGFQQQGIAQNAQDSNQWSAIIAALAKAFGL